MLDKVDVVDALANALDSTLVEGLGWVHATAIEESDGTLILEVFRNDPKEDSVFAVRITKYRPKEAR